MELIPEGKYRAVALQVSVEGYGQSFVQFGESSAGNPQVIVNFEILDGEYAGRRKTWFGVFTENTTQRTIEALRYCGFKGDDLAAAMSQQLDQEVQIVIGHEEYQGKVSDRIKWVNRGGGGVFKLEKPMDRTGLAQFAAQMKSKVRQVPDAPGARGEKPQRSASPRSSSAPGSGGPPPGWSDNQRPPSDDDIPF
jgi:hypothetical protein